MVIVGAGGFAKEILEILYQKNDINNLSLFDDVNKHPMGLFYDKYPILNNLNSVKDFFKTCENKFTLGIGNPFLRKKMADKFINIGGEISSTISIDAKIGHFGVEIKNGCNILSGAIISNNVYLSTGVIVYFNSVITHDCFIDDFVEISSGVKLLGKSKVGKYSQIGSNCVVLQNINIGNNVIVEAGVIVDKDIPDNCTVSRNSTIINNNI